MNDQLQDYQISQLFKAMNSVEVKIDKLTDIVNNNLLIQQQECSKHTEVVNKRMSSKLSISLFATFMISIIIPLIFGCYAYIYSTDIQIHSNLDRFKQDIIKIVSLK